MAKRRPGKDDDGAKDASPEYHVVFVDTSVDTHLAILVSNFDTVSDFKKKMQLEHGQCFPKTGEIQIQSVKVKRGANFYHLPDVVPVWSAFHGENGDWFLSADVSGTEDDVEIDGMNIDDNCKRLTSDIKRMHNLSTFLPDSVSGKNVVADTNARFEVQKSLETTTGSQSNNCSEANSMGRKKRKVSPAVGVYQNPTLKENFNLLLESGKVTSMLKIIGSGDSMAGSGEEGSEALHLSEQQVKISKAIAEVSAIMSYQSDIEKRGRFVGASSPATSEKSISRSMNENPLVSDIVSDVRKQESRLKSTLSTENFVINEPEQEPGHNQMGAVGGAVQDADSNKKKILKAQIGKVGNTMPNTETLRCQEKGSSLKQDSELLPPSMCKSPEHAEPTLMLQEASFSRPSLNANASTGPEISSGSKKKKKKKKRDNKGDNARLGKSATHQKDDIANATSGSLCPSPDCTTPLGKQDSPMKFLNGLAIHANVKVPDADRGGDDPMLLTKQMVVDMVNAKENMGEKSPCETEIPALERENLVMVFDQVEDKKNREGKNTEPRKKRKKSKHRASDSQVKMSVLDRNFGNVVLENEENLVVDSEEKGRHGASQYLSQRSDERLEDMHGTPGNTDDLARFNNELFPETSLSKRPDNEPDQDLATDYCASASVDLASSSAGLLGTTAAFPETKSDGNKKRKSKLLKDILDTISTDQSGNVDSYLAIRVLSEKRDPELIMPSNCKSSEHDGPALMLDKASFSPPVSDANAIVGPEIASGSKKLKSGKKCADPNQKVHGANIDATNFVPLNQNKQLVEDVATGKEKMVVKTRWEEEAPGMERENQVLEFDQGDKEKSRSKDTKPIKKKKRTKSSVSDIQVNLTVKDQRVDNEVLANEGKSCGIVKPEEESRNAGTSQLLSQKNDQVLENVHALSINRDDPARGKNEGEEINFREYFVPGEYPFKVDSVDMVKRSSKLNGEIKSGEKVKEKRSRTVSSPIESSLVNQENKGASRVRKASGMEQGESVQNSAWDEVISNSSTVTLRVSQTEVKDSSRIHTDDMNAAPKGPRTNQIVSSRLKENSTALDKSSSLRSELPTEKKLNNRSQSGLNATNRMVVKTPPKKSLLTKSGSIFQDDSGESSADENEKVQSDHRTLGPTNSSSESVNSDGESDLSQDSSRNGSSEATGRSKATQKLDLSVSNGMTMDMIFRSSNRFREAKLVAQTEYDIDNQLVETVPESEPI